MQGKKHIKVALTRQTQKDPTVPDPTMKTRRSVDKGSAYKGQNLPSTEDFQRSKGHQFWNILDQGILLKQIRRAHVPIYIIFNQIKFL